MSLKLVRTGPPSDNDSGRQAFRRFFTGIRDLSFRAIHVGTEESRFVEILKFLNALPPGDLSHFVQGYNYRNVLDILVSFIEKCENLSLKSKGLNYLENKKHFDQIITILNSTSNVGLKKECAEILARFFRIELNETNFTAFINAAEEASQLVHASDISGAFEKNLK
ncbi:MAG: hypothetical protein WC501_04260 [Candidatus Micrarchaeia archaeon]